MTLEPIMSRSRTVLVLQLPTLTSISKVIYNYITSVFELAVLSTQYEKKSFLGVNNILKVNYKVLTNAGIYYANPFLGKPGIPRHLEAVSTGPDSVQLVWDVPSNDGGAPIDNYVIEKREASRNVWAAQGTSDRTTYTANNLHEGYQYYFRVAAENSVGMGDFAEMTTSIIPKAPFSKYRKSVKIF